MSERVISGSLEPEPSVVTIAHIIYILHGLSILVALVGSAFVIGAFLFSLPAIVAVILNYVYRGNARGTWLESHFRWQIRTFWFAMLWAALAFVFLFTVGLVLVLSIIGIPLALAPFGVLCVWIIYRVIRGWARLKDRRAMEF
ncbi:MAG: hypothetical protein KF778_16300 [Rhodocyclaceae bacterium]|nr:hypothetical protein [Rhodocyclaceae bacterium]MBX3669963.1 hypothetical protein [Rhodocyclaceae bacterium]